MKKTLLLTLALCIGQLLMAQVSKTLTLATAGTLSTTLTAEEKTSITNLTLSGSIDARDVKCMRDEITKLEVLDLSGASIVEYTGSGGTYSYDYTYPVNEMHSYSFYNTNTSTGKTTLKTVQLPNSLKSIGECAFCSCTGLSSITIPSSVTTIESSAFSQCSSLAIVYCNANTAPSFGANCIPTSVKAVYVPASSVTAYKAATGWSSLNIVTEKRVTINNPTAGSLAANLLSNGYGPLSSITHLTVTGNLKAIDIAQMKSNMTNLTAIDLSGATLANNAVPDYAFQDKTMLTSVVLPSTITSIGNYAFSGCSNLSCSIPLPASVTSIGSSAYSGCSNLIGNLIIPADVTSIKGHTFYNCYKLSGVLSIPDGVLSVGDYAFCYCSGLTGVLTIPNSVRDIDNCSFKGCIGLTGDLIIPNSVTYIGSGAFKDCVGFDGSLTLSNSLAYFESGDGAFANCTHFSGTLNIPSTLVLIPDNTFAGCKNLSELTLTENTTDIYGNAFSGCTGLQKITVTSELPPDIYASTFDGVDKESCQLLVPTGAGVTYQTDNYWGLFVFVTEVTATSVPSKEASKLKIYTTSLGISIDGLTIGESVAVYQVDGKLMNTLIADKENIVIPAKRGSIYLLKIGTETFKVAY